jgi:L-lysine 6-transaminase
MNFPYSDSNHEDLLQRELLSVAQIRKAFEDNKDDVCAIIIEPVQSEGGDNHVRKEFLEKLRELADEYEAMLIYDEVQTGVGLTGKFWCHEHFGEKARPDILAFGKKMQVCGILCSNRVDEVENNVFHVSSRINSTWGGSLVDMVRSSKIMEVIEEDNLCDNAAQMGEYLQNQLRDIAGMLPIISNVRGKGLLTAFDFPDKNRRDAFINKGLDNNIMYLGCGEKSIRFRPALIIEKKHIDTGLEMLEKISKSL